MIFNIEIKFILAISNCYDFLKKNGLKTIIIIKQNYSNYGVLNPILLSSS